MCWPRWLGGGYSRNTNPRVENESWLVELSIRQVFYSHGKYELHLSKYHNLFGKKCDTRDLTRQNKRAQTNLHYSLKQVSDDNACGSSAGVRW